MTHRVAEVERTLAAVAALAGEARGELARQRIERLAQRLHLIARRVHELDVFGERFAQRLGHGLGASVGDEATADLGLDLLLELVDAMLVLLALEALLQRRHLALELLLGRLHQLVEHRVEVEVPQRAIQVVRATDWSAGLHPREPLDRLAGHRPHHRLVAAHQRLHQQVSDLLGCQRIEPASGAALAVTLTHLFLHLAEHVVDLGLVTAADLVLGTAEAEVDLEHRLERPPVRVVLDQRGAQRVLEGVPVIDRDVLDGLHRVEVLGQADR